MAKKQLTKREGIVKLKKLGIKTTADLDNWREKNGKYIDPRIGGTCVISRYDALKKLVGENAAMWILNDLANAQCALSKEVL